MLAPASPVNDHATVGSSSGPAGGVLDTDGIQIAPAPPHDVLWDQYDPGSGFGAPSQNFEAPFDENDSEGADDFAVPAGEHWNIRRVDVHGVFGAIEAP